MRQVDNELLTAEEKAALAEDVEQLIDDTECLTSATYHATGAETTNWETGVVSEVGGVNISCNALKVKPNKEDLEIMRVQEAEAVYLILASDLSAVTPKVSDYITVSSKKKYVVAFALPMPEIHYRFYVKDAGN